MISKKKYDYLIVGAGLYGCVIANQLNANGKKCIVLEKRSHIGGNLYCEDIQGINVHKYGPHIFHTNNKECWNFICSFVEMNHFRYSPLANYKGKLYNLPFNMNTFHQIWRVNTPIEAQQKINSQRNNLKEPSNLEEQAIAMVGTDIYNILIKGYSEKQWGRKAIDLPPFIIKRLPLRFQYDNNYFDDRYQGIPVGGYNRLINALLKDIEVKCNVNFFKERAYWEDISDRIIFTGRVDEFYDYCFGKLEYRSLNFEHKLIEYNNYQGVAVINFTEYDIPFTRIIEHKHFEFGAQEHTVITKEYPVGFSDNNEPYYPVNDTYNNILYKKYKSLTENQNKYQFGGRLGNYSYYDMDDTILAALEHSKRVLNI